MNTGMADGARTHDNRNHNPYQTLAFMRVSVEFFGIYSIFESTIWRYFASSIPKKWALNLALNYPRNFEP